MRWRRAVLAIGLIFGLAGEAAAQQAIEAEVAGAVSLMMPVAIRTGTAAAPVELHLRDPVFMNDRIATSGDGGTRITFVDGSELTIGPASELVIDRFVYSPVSGTSLIGRVGVGALRFTSGAGRHDATFVGPVATMGLRGTTLDIYSLEGGGQLLHVIEGFVAMAGTRTRGSLVGPGQFGFVNDPDGPVIVGDVVGSILEVMERLGFRFPRGQAIAFLALAGTPRQVTFEEILQIAGLRLRLDCPEGGGDQAGGCGGLVVPVPAFFPGGGQSAAGSVPGLGPPSGGGGPPPGGGSGPPGPPSDPPPGGGGGPPGPPGDPPPGGDPPPSGGGGPPSGGGPPGPPDNPPVGPPDGVPQGPPSGGGPPGPPDDPPAGPPGGGSPGGGPPSGGGPPGPPDNPPVGPPDDVPQGPPGGGGPPGPPDNPPAGPPG